MLTKLFSLGLAAGVLFSAALLAVHVGDTSLFY